MADSNLFKRLGLAKLSDQERLNLSEDLGEIVLDRVAGRLEAILTASQMLEFETMLQTDEAKAFVLLETFAPDYSLIVQEEIEYLNESILSTHSEVMKKLKH